MIALSLLLLLFPLALTDNCPTEFTYIAAFNKCYFLAPSGKHFQDAEQDCLRSNAHLVSVQSHWENHILTEMYGSRYSYGWIGASKLYTGGRWGWTDTAIPFTYTNWNGINNSSSYSCGTMESRTGLWQPRLCDDTFNYVCDYYLPPLPTCTAPTSCPPTYYCGSGWTYFAETNQCYRVIKDNMNNQQAEAQCESLGGHLASIHSQAENDFVADLAATGLNSTLYDMTWIGVYKNSIGYWANFDGTLVNYTNWAPGEPTNTQGVEWCVQIYSDSTSNLVNKWNDCACSLNMRAAVCKKLPY